jgi:hypothetical protein
VHFSAARDSFSAVLVQPETVLVQIWCGYAVYSASEDVTSEKKEQLDN